MNAYLRRMETECIDVVLRELFEVVKANLTSKERLL
jgi:hypothetical protein